LRSDPNSAIFPTAVAEDFSRIFQVSEAKKTQTWEPTGWSKPFGPRLNIRLDCSYRLMEEITDLSSEEAREFFLQGESYCEFDTPTYFDFEPLLSDVWDEINGSELHSYYSSPEGEPTTKPRDCEGVNFTLLQNKDGRFAWRPLELIHPVLYVDLVQDIISDWNLIRDRLAEFQNIPTIEARGLPARKSEEDKSDKAATVKKWWRTVELSSIELALEYEYIFHTDVTDCYGSIYTHSVPWVLHTKEVAKKKENQNDDDLVGNCIDWTLQDMNHGQTNGIPQGSQLMDFIAEIVLGYADIRLYRRLKKENLTEYKILRYRDDYRVYTNNPQKGEEILKHLTKVLLDLNMELSSEKTYFSDDVVQDSIKPDKMDWMLSKQKKKSFRKQLLLIHDFSKEHPNSGMLKKALDDFFDRLTNISSTLDHPVVLISILTDIAYRNPRVYPYFAAILSKLLYHLDSTEKRREVISKVSDKFSKLPNTNHLSMWLQRITMCSEIDYEYTEDICRRVVDSSVEIWNSDWLEDSPKQVVTGASIVDDGKIEELSPQIQGDEVKLFSPDYPL